MPLRSGGTAPYAPPATVLGLVQAYRNRGLTTPFTAEVLTRASVPDSLIARTLQSLKLLDLTDDAGNPTPELEGLRRAGEQEYRQRLEALVKAVYAEVFQFVDPAKDDATRIRDAFRAFEPIGQLGRMVTLFIGLCDAAGIVPEGTKKPAAPSTTRPSAPRKRKPDDYPGSVSTKAPVRNATGGLIPQAVLGLLSALPAEGEAFPTDRRESFKKMLDGVFHFVYTEGEDERADGAE